MLRSSAVRSYGVFALKAFCVLALMVVVDGLCVVVQAAVFRIVQSIPTLQACWEFTKGLSAGAYSAGIAWLVIYVARRMQIAVLIAFTFLLQPLHARLINWFSGSFDMLLINHLPSTFMNVSALTTALAFSLCSAALQRKHTSLDASKPSWLLTVCGLTAMLAILARRYSIEEYRSWYVCVTLVDLTASACACSALLLCCYQPRKFLCAGAAICVGAAWYRIYQTGLGELVEYWFWDRYGICMNPTAFSCGLSISVGLTSMLLCKRER